MLNKIWWWDQIKINWSETLSEDVLYQYNLYDVSISNCCGIDKLSQNVIAKQPFFYANKFCGKFRYGTVGWIALCFMTTGTSTWKTHVGDDFLAESCNGVKAHSVTLMAFRMECLEGLYCWLQHINVDHVSWLTHRKATSQ